MLNDLWKPKRRPMGDTTVWGIQGCDHKIFNFEKNGFKAKS